MRAYVGQTRAKDLLAMLKRYGIGECTVRGEMPPRRPRWFYDNGAFTDWKAGEPFDYLQWSRDMRAIRLWQDAEGIPQCRPRGGERLSAPDFIVLPDLVAQGTASLEFSLEHLEESERTGAPLYLAVQDGMTPADLETLPASIAGLFIGGSLEWKLETAEGWITWAHARGLKVHIGRVGTIERVRWARSIGADSIDSAFPLWTRERLAQFVVEVAA